MADFFPNAIPCGVTPPTPVPDDDMLISDSVPDAPGPVLGCLDLADAPLATPFCGQLDVSDLFGNSVSDVDHIVFDGASIVDEGDGNVKVVIRGSTTPGTTVIYVDNTFNYTNVTFEGDLYLNSLTFEGDLIFNNLNILVSADSFLTIDAGQTFYINGTGTLQTCAPLVICGDLYLCSADIPVVSIAIVDLDMPENEEPCGRVVVRFTGAGSNFALHSVLSRGPGMIAAFINTTTKLMTVKHQGSGTSSATFRLPGDIDMRVKPNGGFVARKTSDGWEVITEIGHPLNSKGDIWTHDGIEDQALPAGGDWSLLVPLATESNGLFWFPKGMANQVLGMNDDGTALEWKTITDGTGILVTSGPGVINIENLCCDYSYSDSGADCDAAVFYATFDIAGSPDCVGGSGTYALEFVGGQVWSTVYGDWTVVLDLSTFPFQLTIANNIVGSTSAVYQTSVFDCVNCSTFTLVSSENCTFAETVEVCFDEPVSDSSSSGGGSSSSGGSNFYDYTVPGDYEWVCPEGRTSIDIHLWGSGGHGDTNISSPFGGAGGGGGGQSHNSGLSVTPGLTYTIHVPAGGDQGAATFKQGVTTLASAGSGTNGFTTGSSNPGPGGTADRNGGNGSIGGFDSGGGGGGSAGPSDSGNPGGSPFGGSAVAGGGAGGDGGAPASVGSSGSYPGGAGGGSGAGGFATGGFGADGRVTFSVL